jgi:hypothetical protein
MTDKFSFESGVFLSTSKKSWVSPSPEQVVGIVLVVLCVYRLHIELASGSFRSCHAGPA